MKKKTYKWPGGCRTMSLGPFLGLCGGCGSHCRSSALWHHRQTLFHDGCVLCNTQPCHGNLEHSGNSPGKTVWCNGYIVYVSQQQVSKVLGSNHAKVYLSYYII
jgi:hypothetical protein